jgi:phage tail sheath gpL-like
MLEQVKSLGYGGAFLNDKLPRVIAELQGYTISGPLAGVAANNAIAVTEAPEYQDTLQKVLMFAAGVPSDITSSTSIIDRRAAGSFTLSGVVAGDTVTVNGKVYTAVTFASTPTSGQVPPYSFAVGADNTATAANLAQAIQSADGTTVSATAALAVVSLKAVALGVAGNSIALATSGAHAVRSAATLTGGTATQGLVSTTNTTGNTVVVFWYKKSRVVGQA